MDKRAYYSRLILKYFYGEISVAEQTKLKDWLKSSPENQALFNAAEEVFHSKEKEKQIAQRDADEVFDKMMEKIEQRSFKKRHLTQTTISTQVWRAAAVFILMLGSLLIISLLRNTSIKLELVVVTTQQGEQKIITLPDSSKVWLTGNSFIQYPRSFENQESREIKLEGEGFFDVTKNPHKPFIVSGNRLQVRVLGTRFRFISDSMNNAHRVIVTEGKVQVSDPALEETPKALLPKQGVTYNENNLKYEQQQGVIEIPWQQNYWQFKNMTIKEIIDVLQRSYGVVISYPASLGNTRISIDLKRNSVEYSVLELSKTLLLDFVMEGKKIEMRLKK